MCKKENSVYRQTIVITNKALVQGDYLTQIEKAASLHPKAVILREKELTEDAYRDLAEQVQKICKEYGVDCIVHSRIKTAGEIGCPNIHLSIPAMKNLTVEQNRKLRRDFSVISVSCHSAEDVQFALKAGATQIVLGTIFETDCKKGLKGRGTGFVRQICEKCPLPVYAIGGITPERLPEVMAAGAAGGCMMSYFMHI